MTAILDVLINLAGEHARRILIEQKQSALRPMFLFVTPAGRTIVPCDAYMDSGDAKEALAESMRALMREQGAVAYSFISEAWMATVPSSSPLPRDVRSRPDRIEIVYAVAFDAAGDARSACWRMIRDPHRKILALEPEPMPTGPDVLAGRFANLLGARA